MASYVTSERLIWIAVGSESVPRVGKREYSLHCEGREPEHVGSRAARDTAVEDDLVQFRAAARSRICAPRQTRIRDCAPGGRRGLFRYRSAARFTRVFRTWLLSVWTLRSQVRN